MANFVLTDAKVLINSVDLSAYVRSVKVNYKAETPDNTAMGATTHSRLAGLKDWDLDIELNQDFAVSQVDATLFPLIGAAAFPIEIRPTSAARSTSNPGYTGNALLTEYPPLGQKVGDVAATSIKLVAAGALARQTS